MSTSSISKSSERPNLLGRVMRGNGIFSGLSGLICLVGAKPLAAFTGIDAPAFFVFLGVVLLLYAVGLFSVTMPAPVDRRFGQAAVVLDVAWVIGSVVILLVGWPPLTVAGKWGVALLAEVVFVFAVLQAYALRRSRNRR